MDIFGQYENSQPSKILLKYLRLVTVSIQMDQTLVKISTECIGHPRHDHYPL